MDESLQDCSEIFSQDGILLKQAPATHITFLNTIGTLYLSESPNSNRKRYIEWKPNDITVDSDVQDQEWAVVNTVQKRNRTLSGNYPPDYHNRIKCIKFCFEDIKSFRVANKNRQLSFHDGKADCLCVFGFQHGNCETLLRVLKSMMKTSVSKRDKHLYIVYDANFPEFQQLDRSFAELNIQNDSRTLWSVFKNLKDHPYEATFEAFSKVTDYVYRSPEHREFDEVDKENLNRSITEYENTTSHSHGDYEVVATVPERKDFPRLRALTVEQWNGHLNGSGQIEDVESIKNLIFRGGVIPSLRKRVWKFLLDYYPWSSTKAERQKLLTVKSDEYYNMKLQWKRMTKVQEDNFSDYRDRKSLIEKDVARTDRALDFYAGDNNANLQTLNDILMTYIMYNFDLGYVQGMSDLLSPILQLLENEVDSFWCFVGFMNKMSRNFDIDQAGMKDQLNNLHTLLAFVNPQLANYLDTHDSGNMFFCFRWLLVWFKRELSQEDIMRFWEVLWTGYPCENFHLLVCVAILETEKNNIIHNNYGFTEILKHINDLNGKLDMAVMLNKAEGIYYQIKEADHLTDNIRLILGLPILQTQNSYGSHEQSPFEDSSAELSNSTQPCCSVENVRISPDEVSYEREISLKYIGIVTSGRRDKMITEFAILLLVFPCLNTQNAYSGSEIYFPSENGGLANDENYPQITSRLNLSEVRGTSTYEKYVDQLIAGGIARLTLEINRSFLQKRDSEDDNIVFAPLNIGGALALVLLGSNGKTFEELTSVLGLATDMEITRNSERVHEQLGRIIGKLQGTPGLEVGEQVNFAMAVFVQKNYPIRSVYKEAAEDLYGSEVLNVDFESHPAKAQQVINAWVSDRTNGKIKDILSDVPSAGTKVIVASAMYFKALWEKPFFVGTTTRRPFFTNGRNHRNNTEVEMMAMVEVPLL
ncbi:hypothetical protein JTB14_001079 [Gonioctena quinquepunctata]|nr:hypothetical protein JTB14_001079 [Gonioctena quinquepunctata]